MIENLNILILSCGTRNKIVQYFKKEVNGKGKVIATDCSPLAPALYDADEYFIVPNMEDDNYLKTILSICKEHQVKVVLSLIDPELKILAENKESFIQVGTTPIVSDLEIIQLAFNKYKMHEFLIKNDMKTIKSYSNKNDFYEDFSNGKIDFPIFVKPIEGSASLNINKVTTNKELESLFKKHEDLMIQEFIDGIEYGADVYVDLISKKPVSIFIKEKLKMRAGETDKSISIIDEYLFDMIENFVEKAGFVGIIDIDFFEKDGEYYISEVNPRFGGGYPHAYESGVNVPKMIVNNLNNIVNNNEIGNYDEGVCMLKYSEIRVINSKNELLST